MRTLLSVASALVGLAQSALATLAFVGLFMPTWQLLTFAVTWLLILCAVQIVIFGTMLVVTLLFGGAK